jgi:hypothetical protein
MPTKAQTLTFTVVEGGPSAVAALDHQLAELGAVVVDRDGDSWTVAPRVGGRSYDSALERLTRHLDGSPHVRTPANDYHEHLAAKHLAAQTAAEAARLQAAEDLHVGAIADQVAAKLAERGTKKKSTAKRGATDGS